MFITHQVIRFASSVNADENALSSSLCEYLIVPAVSNDTWMQSNKNQSELLLFPSPSCGRKQISPGFFPRRIPGNVADPSSLSVQEKYECDDNIFEFENDCIFVFATEVNGKDHHRYRRRASRELHDGLREDHQWKDNQYEMRHKIESRNFF